MPCILTVRLARERRQTFAGFLSRYASGELFYAVFAGRLAAEGGESQNYIARGGVAAHTKCG